MFRTQIDKLELPDGANLSPSHFSQIRKALYHACMEEILRPLERSFRYPFSMACGDGVTRDLCVTFPILSMDYEEACVSTVADLLDVSNYQTVQTLA